MKTSKIMIVCVVLLLSGAIVWQVAIRGDASLLPGEKQVKADEPEVTPSVAESNETDANDSGREASKPEPSATPTPAESNEPPAASVEPVAQTQPEPTVDTAPKPAEVNEPNKPEEPKEPMEALNLKDVQMKDIIKKITDWTDKVVIPTGDAMKQKITIFSPKEVTRPKALALIYAALRTQGYMAEEDGDVIYLKPLKEAKLGKVPVVGPDEPLAVFENKEQVVQKFFKLNNYNANEMVKIIKPLIAEYGMVSADTATATVTVIETINNLMRIQSIIGQFDVPEAEQAMSELIPVQVADPVEIVQFLQVLLDNSNTSRSYRTTSRYTGGAVTIPGQGSMPIILIPQSQNMIIARASAQDMKLVKEWIDKLDRTDTSKAEYEMVFIEFADTYDVARQIQDALRNLPGSAMLPNVLVRPVEQSKQVMIFGNNDMRQLAKNIIKEVDIPAGEYEKKTFKLEYADPDQIVNNIESLYTNKNDSDSSYRTYTYNYNYNYSDSPSRRSTDPDLVRAIALSSLQQVTVIASAENMSKIKVQIEEWDKPLDVDQVKPRIITLKNSDPVQLTQLLNKLFSEDDSSSIDLYEYLYGYSMPDSKKKIVGPLYGQLTFEDVPGTKKIIIISKVPEAYKVIEELIAELDSQEMAEVPEVIPLKYADPESLAERLNALFNESGTNASIRFMDRSLGESMTTPAQNGNNNNNNNGNRTPNRQDQSSTYAPWWNDQRRTQNEEPISNVIGKVRFIPDTHSKSLLVLAAPEFMESIKETVHKLDIPGKQVLIKAVVIEVDHSSMTSLGVQLSTNPDAFGNLGENSVRALSQLTHMATHGSAAVSNTGLGYSGSGTVAGVGADIYSLIDFLAKTVNAKILNQQSLWTKDNERANFFKGDIVAFTEGSSVGSTDRVTSDIDFKEVGMTLEVRPSITPEEKVDMLIHVNLSQLTDEVVNGQPVRGSMDTSTKMIVESGETLMLAGILFQKDSVINRKVPLLGDVPVLGGLFRHKQQILANNELIVFIIPEVIDDGKDMKDAASEIMQEPIQKLDQLKENMSQKLQEAGVIQ